MNYTDASIAEIDAAIAAAKAAFPIYRRISDAERAEFLQAISREILAIGDDLIQTACEESHLPEARITGERGRTTGQIQAFADFISNPAWKKEIHDPAQPD
ncbi:MAG: Aldehyde dehydrogenase, partial [Bacteroidota bacterium]